MCRWRDCSRTPTGMKTQLSSLIIAALATILTCATARAETGYLASAIKLPVVINGKAVGSTTLAAGTTVEILRQDDSKVLIKTAPGEVWVDANKVAASPPQSADTARSSPPTPHTNGETSAHVPQHASDEDDIAPIFHIKQDNPQVPATGETEVPADFAWDRTLIIPGKFAFLNLPFIKQTKPGICVGAAAINVVRYLCPENRLSANEFFKLMTDKPAGASDMELIMAMRLLGLPGGCRTLAKANVREDIERVKSSLDKNLPILAADRRHMVVITGYNAATKKIFVWNQWGNGKIINAMPKGHYELLETDLPIEFAELVFCSKVRYEPAEDAKSSLESCVGATEDLQMHPCIKGPLPFSHFLSHAGPERLKAALRSNRTLLLPKGDSVLCVMPSEADGKSPLQCVTLPQGVKSQMSIPELSDDVFRTTHGNFYSVKRAEKLAAADMP